MKLWEAIFILGLIALILMLSAISLLLLNFKEIAVKLVVAGIYSMSASCILVIIEELRECRKR